jgi:membrane associated rhomboid family serine protease
MLYLYIFGDNVEDRLGHGRYVLFYLISGAVAGITQVRLSPLSPLPIIGASGAVAGVLGAYFFLYPRARIVTLIPVFFFFHLVYIPAFLFLIIWLLMQFLFGAGSLAVQGGASGGVAWWAHIGGFVAGLVLVVFLKKRSRRTVWDELP